MTSEDLRDLWRMRDQRYLMRRLALSYHEIEVVRGYRRREITRMVEQATEHAYLLKEVAGWMPPR